MTTIENFLKLNKNRQIWTILKDQSVLQALILMSEKNIGAIIIVDNNDFPIGIFSERDYARKIILKGKSSEDTLLDEVMTKELITVTRNYKIDQCMEIMNEKRIRHLPVLENKKIVKGLDLYSSPPAILSPRPAARITAVLILLFKDELDCPINC